MVLGRVLGATENGDPILRKLPSRLDETVTSKTKRSWNGKCDKQENVEDIRVRGSEQKVVIKRKTETFELTSQQN